MSERAGAADDAGEGLAIRAGVDQGPVVRDVLRIAARSKTAGRSDHDRACADGGRAAVGVVAGERERAGGVLGERARAADDAGEGLGIRSRVDESSVVGDVLRIAARHQSA